MKPRHGYGAEPRGLGWRKKFIFKVLERNTRVFFCHHESHTEKKNHTLLRNVPKQTDTLYFPQTGWSLCRLLSVSLCVCLGRTQPLVSVQGMLSQPHFGRKMPREGNQPCRVQPQRLWFQLLQMTVLISSGQLKTSLVYRFFFFFFNEGL